MQESETSAAQASPDMPASDSGQVVVLTGASSGIGRATALAFAQDGARLILASRNAEALAEVVQECEQAGGSAVAVPTDVTDPDAVASLARAAVDRFGRIDVWINNVGVGAVGLFDETPLAAHRRVIEANLLGHIHGAYAALPYFRKQGRGTLINMISLGGWVAAPYATAYTASKFGLRGFSESLRAEMVGAPGIHVCEVFPTFVDTPGMSHGANYSGHRVRPPPPVIDPRRVARALVALAKKPRATTYIGAPALPGILAHAIAPNLVAKTMMWLTERSLARSASAQPTDGNLFDASRGTAVDGGFRAGRPDGRTIGLLTAGVGLIALAGIWATRGRRAHL